jgi:predicted transcriptional regulator
MLIVETVGRIRREHFVLGKTIKEIARDLRLSRNTVRKVLRSAETAFSYEREVQPRPKLGRLTEGRIVGEERRRAGARAADADPDIRGAAGARL